MTRLGTTISFSTHTKPAAPNSAQATPRSFLPTLSQRPNLPSYRYFTQIEVAYSMYQQHYYVPKHTGTLADLLLAFGAADALAEIMRQVAPGAHVTLVDHGSYYVIDTDIPLQKEWLPHIRSFDLIPFLSSGREQLPDDLPHLAQRNVDAEWETFRRYAEQRKQLGESGLTGEALELALTERPKADWTVATYLGDYRMQAAQAIHNSLVIQWTRAGMHDMAHLLRTLLQLFDAPNADWNAVAQEWKKNVKALALPDHVTASQLFNPHMGKGQNQAKANKLTMSNEKSFWMVEYLKAVGVWRATAPTKATNADVRKTYVLAPRRIDMRFHDRVFEAFRTRLWNSGAVKQDVVATLLYAEVLLEHCIEEDDVGVFDDGPISNVVTGMGVATYQLLSANAYTTMNLAFLGVPDWMPEVRCLEDALTYRAILREHHERVRSIDDDRSEGYALLQLYRDFVSGNDLTPFFEFLADYSSYLTSALDHGQYYIKPFSETNLRRLLIMLDPQLSPILENEGFRNVADAIRRSTVIPLYRGKESRFDVRYGLGRDMIRKSQYKEDFIQALTDFMHDYNDETMRVHERTHGQARRKLITTRDIEAIVYLLDTYGSKTVCNLLVAFGYARDPREIEETAQVDAASQT